MPALSALRAFEATARLGGFSAAGRELSVTHAAVAQQVRALERRLETTLVVREGRGLRLTPEGGDLARELAGAFSAIADAVERLATDAAQRPIRVTMTPSFASQWFMPRYADFRRRHPEHDLILHPSADLVDLEGGGADVAIRYGAGDWPGVEVSLLLMSHYVIVGAPDLVPGAVAGPQDLVHLPWFAELGSTEVEHWRAANGLGPETKLRVTEMPGHLVLQVLREGAGLAATAEVFVREDIRAGRLKVYWKGQSERSGYWIVTRRGAQRPAIRDFVRWLKAASAPAQG